ncbi:MAG: hypothetical protein WCX82_00135 [archaeon]
MDKNMVPKIQKILLIIIISIIIIVTFSILNSKFNIIGKSTEVLSGIIDGIDVNPITCKSKISNTQITDHQLSTEINVRYNQEMNTEINPTITLDRELSYTFEESQWTNNTNYSTKLIIEDKDQEKITNFLISGGVSKRNIPQAIFDSKEYKLFINIHTKNPELEKITIYSNLEDTEMSKITLDFSENIFVIDVNPNALFFIGNENNTIYKIDSEKNKVFLYVKPRITRKNLIEYHLILKKDTITNQYKNFNKPLDFYFNEETNIPYEIIEPELIDPPIIEDNFKITQFEIEQGSSNAIVYFSEGVYSNNNSALNISNFTIENNGLQENIIKGVSHLAGENKAVISFNKIITDYENLKIITNNIYDASGKQMITENSTVFAKNNRLSLALKKGWNLVSFPKPLAENWNIFSNLSDSSSNIEIYTYIDNSWVSLPLNTNTYSEALFIKSTKPQELNLLWDRSKITTLDVSNLKPGWNLIGFPIDLSVQYTFYIDDILINPDLFTQIIVKGTNYNTTEFTQIVGTDPSIPLSPYEGYWIYIENNPLYKGN